MRDLLFILFATLLFLSGANAQELAPGSKLFLSYLMTDNEDNVDGEDAKAMLRDYIEGKTRCVVVYQEADADFVAELRVIKKGMGNRRAMITIKNIGTRNTVFESKWTKGTSNVYYEFSSTKHAIGRIVKNQLLKKYPMIKI